MNSGRAVASTLRLTAGRSYKVLTAREVAASGNLMRVISTNGRGERLAGGLYNGAVFRTTACTALN
jgi:hypothetical protein